MPNVAINSDICDLTLICYVCGIRMHIILSPITWVVRNCPKAQEHQTVIFSSNRHLFQKMHHIKETYME